MELAPLTDEDVARCAAFVDANGFSWGYYAPAKQPAELQHPHTQTVLLTEIPDDDKGPGYSASS